MMKVLLTGAEGQLGREIRSLAAPGVTIIPAGRGELDITDADQVLAYMESVAPDAVINAAAYTKVDLAESEPEKAYAVNETGAVNLARAAAGIGARMVHVSTDFVFDGQKSSPYLPSDQVNPLSVYGASKAAGEKSVLEAAPGSLIVRTSWVYSAHGANFMNTMLRLMRERDSLRVVADQVGTPTSTRTLAEALLKALSLPEITGIMHWTDAGAAGWYDFAVAIMEEGLAQGVLDHSIKLTPIRTEEYRTPAIRPAYSVLDKQDAWSALDMAPVHWRVALRDVLRIRKESSV
jgi:dTDP-4-dehydrorhamnose reductase